MKNVFEFLSDPDMPVVVCESMNFIYIRNSRTASTSLYRHLLQKQLRVETLNSKEDPDGFKVWLKQLDRSKWDGYYKFSGIRNPWDRIVSVYHYIVKNRYKIPFAEYVNNIRKYDSDKNLFEHRKPCSVNTHFKKQPMLDFLYRFEHINQDFAVIAKRIGIKQRLPRKNATQHMHYRKYYDAKTRAIVGKLLAVDVKNYNYKY